MAFTADGKVQDEDMASNGLDNGKIKADLTIDEADNIPLIKYPWVEIILPAFSTGNTVNLISDQDCDAILQRLQTPEDDLPLNTVSFETQASSYIDRLELERRAAGCREVLTRLTDSHVPIHELCPPVSRREEEFFAVGLRYLLPYNRDAPRTALRLLMAIFSKYFSLPYHHCGHAALVAHSTVEIVKMMGLWNAMSSLDKKALVISAIGHDIGHPGKSSSFLIKLSHPLALLYNDHSVLENYHCSSLMQILAQQEYNVLHDANHLTEQSLRKQIIQAILWTDLVEHYNIMNQMKSLMQKYNTCRGPEILDQLELKSAVLALALKCGDLSYMALEPIQYAVQWAIDYYEEVFVQRALEIELRLTPSDNMDVYSLGTTQWFERNAKFGIDIVLPIGRLLAEMERRFHKKQSDESSRNSVIDLYPYDNVTLTTANTQLQLVKSFKTNDLAKLSQVVAEAEVNHTTSPSKPPTTSSKAISSRNLTSSTSTAFASRVLSKVTPSKWMDKDNKVRKTNIYNAIIQPLERNCDLYRRAKYLTRAEYDGDLGGRIR